ncbi:MAG: RhuM family protein [Patescibacteria group bacterium]|nr:RhuM family protein [Patescibacteria group bacterium]
MDIILAVGYRTNSKRAIEFRQWAGNTYFDTYLNRQWKNYTSKTEKGRIWRSSWKKF